MEPQIDIELQDQQTISNKRATQLTVAAGLGAGILAYSQPAKADPVADVTSMVTSLGTITTAVTAVIIGAMTVRLAIKMVNRLTVKG